MAGRLAADQTGRTHAVPASARDGNAEDRRVLISAQALQCQCEL